MITRTNSTITVNGETRNIDVNKLYELSRKYLPEDMSANEKDHFIDEVVFNMENLNVNDIKSYDKDVEKYMFAACLRYAEDNGYDNLFNEEDSTNVFEYWGIELEYPYLSVCYEFPMLKEYYSIEQLKDFDNAVKKYVLSNYNSKVYEQLSSYGYGDVINWYEDMITTQDLFDFVETQKK